MIARLPSAHPDARLHVRPVRRLLAVALLLVVPAATAAQALNEAERAKVDSIARGVLAHDLGWD